MSSRTFMGVEYTCDLCGATEYVDCLDEDGWFDATRTIGTSFTEEHEQFKSVADDRWFFEAKHYCPECMEKIEAAKKKIEKNS